MPSDYIHTYANGCIRPLAFPTGFDSPGHHDPPRSSFMNALPPVRLDVRSSGTGKGYWSTSTYCTPHTAPHTDKLCRHSWALLRWAVPNWRRTSSLYHIQGMLPHVVLHCHHPNQWNRFCSVCGELYRGLLQGLHKKELLLRLPWHQGDGCSCFSLHAHRNTVEL